MKKAVLFFSITIALFSSIKASISISDAFLEKIFNSSLKDVHKHFGENAKIEIIEGHILIKKNNDYIVEVYTDYDSTHINGIEIYSKNYTIGGLAIGTSINTLTDKHPYAKFEISHDDGFSLNTALNAANCGVKDQYTLYLILRSTPEYQYDYESYITDYVIKDIQKTEKIQSILIFKK